MNIKNLINNLQLVSSVIPDYTEGRSRGLADDEVENIALEAVYQAIEALEKQIPKKPECILKFDSGLGGRCQVCSGIVREGQSYCSDCGQKIDWGLSDG